MAKIDFSSNTELGEKLSEWWQGLEHDRGQRAELRRAKNVTDVIMLPCFHRVCRQFAVFFKGQHCWQERFAFIVGVLSHVKQMQSGKVAEQMAMASGDKPVVSELRFRRLLQCERSELYVALIRVIRILDGCADIHDLANDCYYWGDNVRKCWAFNYYSKIN